MADNNNAATSGPQQGVAEDFVKEVREEVANKLNDDPEHITHEDAAKAQSVEHRALGHRPPSGSVAAQALSMGDKVEHLHQVVDAAQEKLDTKPASVTADDAKQVLSAEHKVLGHLPPKDSISANMQRAAAANERPAEDGVPNEGAAAPAAPRARRQSIAAAEQSHNAREKNYEVAAQEMKEKLENHPEDITKDDAKHMRRLDTRAHGVTEKGSLTAQVQSEADKHENGAKAGEAKTGAHGEAAKAAGNAEPSDMTEAAVTTVVVDMAAAAPFAGV